MRAIKKIFYLLFVVSLLANPHYGLALTESTSGGNLFADISPKNPASFQDVNIKLTSFGADLDRTNISWLVNKKLEVEGVGIREFRFKTGAVGQQIVVDIIAKTNGGTIQKTITINPADVDIIWEANGHVPATYKGKALVSENSDIRIVALPNLVDKGVKLDPSRLIYTWSKNFEKVASGYNKSTIYTNLESQFSEDKISVTVSNVEGNIVAEKIILLKSTKKLPIIFYEQRPLEQTRYEQAIQKDFELSTQEITLKVEPYFISQKYIKDLKYSWYLNSRLLPSENTNSIVLRHENGGQGVSLVGLKINNTYGLNLNKKNEVLIKFGNIKF